MKDSPDRPNYLHRIIVIMMLAILAFVFFALIVSILSVFNLIPTLVALLVSALMTDVAFLLTFIQTLLMVFPKDEVEKSLRQHWPRLKTVSEPVPTQRGRRVARGFILLPILFLLLSIFFLPIVYVVVFYPIYIGTKCDAYPVNDYVKVVGS